MVFVWLDEYGPELSAEDSDADDVMVWQAADGSPMAPQKRGTLATWLIDQIEAGAFDAALTVGLGGVAVPSDVAADASAVLKLGRAGGAGTVYLYGEGAGGFRARRASADNGAPSFSGDKQRGTLTSPAVPIQFDRLVQITGRAWDGVSAYRQGGVLYVRAIPATPSATDMEGEFCIDLSPAGSVTPSAVANFTHRYGLRFGASSVVITSDRHFQHRSYTVAEVAGLSASPAGRSIYVSDESGGAVLAFSDGTNWRRVTDRAVVS